MKTLLISTIFMAIFSMGCGEYKPPESVLDSFPRPKPFVYNKAWDGPEEAVKLFNEADTILRSGADPEDFKKAYNTLVKVGKLGSLNAITAIASLYRTGYRDGLEKDLVKACKFYRMAADKGYPHAQHDLGRRYASGEGVEKDLKEALKWFKASADQGLVFGYSELAQAYERGEGTPVNMKESIKYYYWAALSNMSFAQYNLAILVGRGEGVSVSKIDSHKWAIIAAANGYANAVSLVERQQPMLEANERAHAEKLATEWLKENKSE